MSTIESNFSPLNEYQPPGSSVVIQGTDWQDAEIQHFEQYGVAFDVNLHDFPHFTSIETNILVLRALGLEEESIALVTSLTPAKIDQAQRTSRSRLRGVRNKDVEDLIHKSIKKGLFSLASPTVEASIPIKPLETAGISGAAAGMCDNEIAKAIRRHKTIENFSYREFSNDMEDFYERAGIPNRVGSVLSGHATGILDTRNPLGKGTLGGALIHGLSLSPNT